MPAILAVTDTDPGIAPENMPHLFERFYRADKSRTRANGRNGLGLAICKAIVDAHGGSLEVDSVRGKGTPSRCGWPCITVLEQMLPVIRNHGSGGTSGEKLAPDWITHIAARGRLVISAAKWSRVLAGQVD